MKNFVRFSKILFSFMVISISLLSCKIELEEEIKFAPPTCNADNGSSVSISLKKYNSDTEYINIYRKDITDGNSNEPFINIGLIFPENLSEEKEVNTFTDKLVKNGHSYIYYARIFDGEKYIKTQESNKVKIPNDASCFNDTDTFTYDISATFTYSKEDYTITIEGTVTPSTLLPISTGYKPVLIVSSSKKSETFPLPTTLDNSTISLRGILSDDFFDTNITVEGICGQKIEYDNSNTSIEEDKRPIKRIFWTEPKNITLSGCKKNQFTVPDNSNNHGFDYSRRISK